MELDEFIKELEVIEIAFERTDKGVVFNNAGSVDLSNLKTLPEGIVFNNAGGVNLNNLTTLPKCIEFNNKGSVYLRNLTTLPEGIVFNNKGSVYLNGLSNFDAYGLGKEKRNIKIIRHKTKGLVVSLGCFTGTKYKAVVAIRKEYGTDSDYEKGVVEAFAKYKIN